MRRSLIGRERLFGAAGALLLMAWLVAGPVAEAQKLGNRLSPVADAYSESNAIRGALGYLELGLTAHAGLPETTFGALFPNTGDLGRFRGQPHVDTHYPPGAILLAAAMRHACGERPFSCLRTLPLAVGALGAGVLALSLVGSLGAVRGLVAALAAVALPLYSNMMLGLHYQGYAIALLSIQVGGLLLLFAHARPPAARDLALAGGLGFLQGWLSFDYFFLVALAPVPIAVLFSDLREPEARRRLFALVLAGTAGFAVAHALHFLQVVAYYGELDAAIQDLLGAASERFDPAKSPELHGGAPPVWASDAWTISSIYLFVLSRSEKYFGFSLGYAVLVALAIVTLLRGARLALPGTGLRLCVEASARPAWTIAAGVIVSCVWIASMRGHALEHMHFIPRHLFLAWLVLVIALLHSIRLERDEPAGPLPGSFLARDPAA